MNKILLSAALCLATTMAVYAQEIVKPKEVKLSYNTVGTPSISVNFTLDLSEDEALDPDFWLTESIRPKLQLKYADQPPTNCNFTLNNTMRKHGFGIKMSGFNSTMLQHLLTEGKDNQITVVFTSDIEVALVPQGNAPAKHFLIKKEDANQMIADQLEITDEDRASFLTALNNFYYYENFSDFGIEPAQDTSQSKYFLTLRCQNAYDRRNFLKCGNKMRSPLYWNFESRLSTDFKDSLNYINFYPVNFRYQEFNRKIPLEFNAKLGHESNQTFSRKRIAADASLNFIIPNLVNLTTASANRLRLKPVIQAGLKGYHDYSISDSEFTSGQIFLNGYYYIPVFANYVIIIEGKSFYDFSEENNPGKKIQGNYSITLGAEIPKTGFKAMFKYVDGKSDINFRQGRIIALGLLMDFFHEKDNAKTSSF